MDQSQSPQPFVDLQIGVTSSLTEAFADALIESDAVGEQRAIARVARRVAERFEADLTIDFNAPEREYFFSQIGLNAKGFMP